MKSVRNDLQVVPPGDRKAIDVSDKDITGQVIGVRGKEIMLFGHMRPIMRVHHAEGWTVERLAEMFPGTLQHHLVPLDTSGQYFNYDPLV